MFIKNKSKVYLGLFLSFVFGLTSIGYVNATTFEERLSQVGLDIASFSNKSSISRYEVARLLNAANCEDCIQAPIWMKNVYTQNFWDNFRAIDGKDFDDVNFEAGVWNKKSYYYCVAYVGDKGYMAGYPSTSTKCKGNFCGQDTITTSEFYQTVLNIVQDQIRTKYRINWPDVKKWMKGLKKNSVQMKVLNQTNINAINNADSKQQYAQNNEEFQAWLKYCMYNLPACNFQSFGVIGAGYWPVSELNILYKEGIITEEDAEKTATFSNMQGAEAIRIFSAVYNNYANCSFNVDYDCDSITNGQDNCPYMYNFNQYDVDGDGIGNVCDDDIDGDGQKNPVGIVDDNNRVVVSLWDDKMDQNPLGDKDSGFSFFVNVDTITSTSPAVVRFIPLTNGDISEIERDFGDGKKQVVSNGNKISHMFNASGTFTVKATATSKNGYKSFAMTKVFIPVSKSENYLLTLSSRSSIKNGGMEHVFTPVYSGDLDTIKWSVNNGTEVSQKIAESFKTTIKEDGFYIVNAKGYSNGELKAVSVITILKDNTQSMASMIVNPGVLWEKTSVITNLAGIDRENVNYISIDWGGEISRSTDLLQSHIYTEPGLKTIQQNVVLKNGEVLSSVATITVQNPLMTQSCAVNVVGNRLFYNQGENLALGLNTYPVKMPISSLFTNYGAGQKNFVYSPDLSKTVLDFAYITAGDKLITNSVSVNRCVSLVNQGTVHINSVDICQSALQKGVLKKYKCDMDRDGIPDICDDDIDGDGVKNLIGIIEYENKDCSIGVDNLNQNILGKGLGVCSLDNCPLTENSNQSDLNNNGIGDLCEEDMSRLVDKSRVGNEYDVSILVDSDLDQDGVADSVDACIDVPGNSSNGCPEFYDQYCWAYSSCGNGVVDEGETCKTCPQDVGICCGNGVQDEGENCGTCSQDVKNCENCGNGKIDKGENCRNCPQDVGECVAFCGNGIVEPTENCMNCPQDVGECDGVCGDGKVDNGENCRNCPQDLKGCVPTCGDGEIDKRETCLNCPWDMEECPGSCGNGKIEGPEECDNGIKNGHDGKCSDDCVLLQQNCGNGIKEGAEECDAGKDNGKYKGEKSCTIACTYFDIKDPECGDGKVDEGENCLTCPIEFGNRCKGRCGDGLVGAGEECDNGEDNGHDGKCTFECEKETNPKSYCGNGVVEIANGEECDLGSRNGIDVQCNAECQKVPEKAECGNGKIEGKEECDYGKNNGKEGINCTKECKNKTKCPNGDDEGEDCEECPEDMGDRCRPNPPEPVCGDGVIDKGENCRNCPQDLKGCVPTCGDGEIDKRETCLNCPWDMEECPGSCGNGKIEGPEECDNGIKNGHDGKCSDDCVSLQQNCGNGIKEGTEECDAGKDNGKYKGEKSCTIACTYFDIKDPECGDGKVDEGENCLTCPIEFGNRCKGRCGDGVVGAGEECDNGEDNGHDGKCTFECEKETNPKSYCGNGVVEIANGEECDLGSRNGIDVQCNAECQKVPEKAECGNGKIEGKEECDYGKNNGKEGINCTKECKNKTKCPNGDDEGEDCEECPEDMGDRCRPNLPKPVCGDGVKQLNEECDYGEDNGKDGINCTSECKVICGNGKYDEGENCEECPEDLGDDCVTPYNPEVIPVDPDIPEPPDDEREIINEECNMCPCEYVDFSTVLARGDIIRAKLWDKSLSAFYRYSNSVSVESFLNFR